MASSWITLYPEYYAKERRSLIRAYPWFRVYEPKLREGVLVLYGELRIHPPGGTKRIPVSLHYPEATPFEKPVVCPLNAPVEFDDNGRLKATPIPRFFNRCHQMSDGALCLFQRETRIPSGDIISGVQTLRRAEQWLLGQETGHMPPDCGDSELQEHFSPIGDVLLSEVFFAESLGARGRFYMVPDLRRAYDAAKGELPAFIMTGLTIEGPVITPIDARKDLSRLYPWIRNDLWNPVQAARTESTGDDNGRAFKRGCWWSLSSEPEPFHDGVALLSVMQALALNSGDSWRAVSQAFGRQLSTEQRLFLALRYPGRNGEPEWLVLCLVQKERKGTNRLIIRTDAQKRGAFEEGRVYCLRTHSARPKMLHLRNTGVVEPTLSEKTVTLIGLGALGSKVAELLAQAGVGRFRLCDSDRLATGNVARHIGALTDFGLPKVEVVLRRLLGINPHLQVNGNDLVFASAVRSLDTLANLINGADLTIATTADESAEASINQLAVILNKPVIYGRSLRRGSIGRVFLVRPRRDACKACLASYAAAEEGNPPPAGWITVPEDPDEVLLHECGRPVIPASAVDLAAIAALIARVALDQLEGHDRNSNHWIWSRAAAPELHSALSNPFSTAALQFPPRPGCFACQEPDVVGLIMKPDVHERIIQLTEASPNAETCGVLIGYVDSERRAVVLRATEPGPNATRSAVCCRRDVEHVQAELERAAKELGEQGKYIGEWHSHLEPNSHPSTTDIDSLVGIAQAHNYLTRCPVMVIAGLDPTEVRVKTLRSWAFPVGGRMYFIENKVAP